MKKHQIIFVLVAFIISFAFAGYGASNGVKDGDVINLTWSSASPSSGAAVVKSTAKATGGIVGVALNGAGTANETVSVATKGVYKLPVTASSTIGSIAIGDYVYTSVSGVSTCTTDLSNNSAGLLFGQALEAVTASTTAGVYSTIKVMIRQPGHL